MAPDKKEKLKKAAKNVVHLTRVKPHDRVVVITDQETEEIGRHIHAAAKHVASAKLVLIEDHTARPAKELPESLVKEIEEFQPTVSVYAAQGYSGELPVFRRVLMDKLIEDLGCRHAHMINIDHDLMEQGMNSDYDAIVALTSKLHDVVSKAKTIRVTSKDGTDITAEIDNDRYVWISSDGIIDSPDSWSNLPDGEIFTYPERVDGVIAARVVGDYLSEKYKVLDEPLLVKIEDSLISEISHPNEELVNDFASYVAEDPMNDRVGEFAIGTNVGLANLTGNLLQDEKFPGLHIAFGHPYPDRTGAYWDAPGHIDLVSPGTSIWADDIQVMDEGKFLI